MKQDKLMLMLLMTGILAMMIPASAPFAMANGDDNGDDPGAECGDDTVGDPLGPGPFGDVKIPPGEDCFIDLATINGNVQGTDGVGTVSITNSHIGGSVQLKGATGTIIISDNNVGTIFGNIQISESDIADGFITVTRNIQPDGSIQLEKNVVVDGDINVNDNFLKDGNIQIEKNGVGGDINVMKEDDQRRHGNILKHGNIQLKENVDPDSGNAVTGDINVDDNLLKHGNIQLEKEKVSGSISVSDNILKEGDVQLKTNEAVVAVNVDRNEMIKRGNVEVAENDNPAVAAGVLAITVIGNETGDGEMKVEKNMAASIVVAGNVGFDKIECKDNVMDPSGLGNCPI